MTLSRRIQRGAALQIAARLFSAVANFVLSAVLLARLLPEGEFGLYQFYLTLFLLASTLVDFGVNQAAVKLVAAGSGKVEQVIAAAIRIKLLTGLLFALGLMTLAWLVEPAGGARLLLILAALHTLGHSLGAASIGFEAEVRFLVPALGVVLGHALFLLAGVLLYLLHVQVAAFYLAAWGGGLVAQNLFVFVTALRRGRIRMRVERTVCLGLLREALPLGVALMAAALYFHMDTIMLRPLRGEAEVARYAVAYRLMTVGLLVPALFMQVVFPVLSRCHERSAELLKIVLARSTFYLALIGGIVAAVLLVLAPELLTLAFGASYRDAATPLRILALAMLSIFLCYPHSMSLIAAGRSADFTRITLSAALFNLLLNLFLIPGFGAEGAALATLVTELFVMVSSMVCLYRARGISGASARLLGPAALFLVLLLSGALWPAPRSLWLALPMLLGLALFGMLALGALPFRIGVEQEQLE